MSLTRRKARGLALQSLYEIDLTKHSADEVLSCILTDLDLTEENASFTRALVKGVRSHLGQIDPKIARYAPAWPVNQLSPVDRNILRLAIFELLFDNETPVRVAINEAVELAKNYGSENSARFINGVLSSISQNTKKSDSTESQEEQSGHSSGAH